jgi:hypothetical protein
MNRNEQIKVERRRRNTDALAGKRRRLQVDESQLDRENFEYRWVNDDAQRVYAMTVQDDWEIVADPEGKIKTNVKGDGTKVSVVAGVGDRGVPVNAILMRKPKAYYDADYAALMRKIDETEAGMKQGATPGTSKGDAEYMPKEGISITHGR